MLALYFVHDKCPRQTRFNEIQLANIYSWVYFLYFGCDYHNVCVNACVCFACMDMHACVCMQLYVTASARVCFSQYAYFYICVCMFCVYLCNGVGTIITLHEGTDTSMAINYL